jgi:hypothetical protein
MRSLAVLALAVGLSSPAWAADQPAEPFGTALAAFIAFPASVAAVLWFLQVPVLGLFQRVGNWFVLALAVMLCAGFCGQALAVDSDGTKPDPKLTPGAIRTGDKAMICGQSTRKFRHVTVTEKVAARRAYGIVGEHGGWCGAEGCEVDHLVPLTVGGGNPPGSIKNLWPMRPDGPNNYHIKDRCEASVGRAICAGKISVSDAQAIFLNDWTVGCAPYLAKAPRPR